jgi:hypothetical protein
MALSKYERKVLADFEAEFTAPQGRWRRVRAALGGVRQRVWRLEGKARALLLPVAVLFGGLAGCALTIAYARPQAAPYVTAVIAAAAGAGVALLWPKRR